VGVVSLAPPHRDTQQVSQGLRRRLSLGFNLIGGDY
jgi:hypothetical protein